jgi:hypothetical protein
VASYLDIYNLSFDIFIFYPPTFTLPDPPALGWAQVSLSPVLFTAIPSAKTVELPFAVVAATWGDMNGA